MQPTSQQGQHSSQTLPSINEHAAQNEQAPLHPLPPRHSRKRSMNSGMETTSAENLAPGAASITEESTSTLAIPAAANSTNGANGAGGAPPPHAPKPPLANRPRPPAIVLYPSTQQPTQKTPNQEASVHSQHLSPRLSGDASEDTEECGSVVYHPSRQSLPVWSTSPAETPSSVIAKATPFFQSDLLQGCPSPSASMQEVPSNSLTAATISPSTSQLNHSRHNDGGPNSGSGTRPRSLDSGAEIQTKTDPPQYQQQQQQQQEIAGQGSKRRQQAASWDSGASPFPAHPTSHSATAASVSAADAAAGSGGMGGGAPRHAQTTSYDTIGTNDITLAPPPLCNTLTPCTDGTSALVATSRGQHLLVRSEEPSVMDGAGGPVCAQDRHGETFMTHNPLAHLPPPTESSQDAVGRSDDGTARDGQQQGQTEGLEKADSYHTAAQFAEAVAAADRAHDEEAAMARNARRNADSRRRHLGPCDATEDPDTLREQDGGEESSIDDVMSGRITVIEEDVMSGRVTVVEEDESGEALAAQEHDAEQREEGGNALDRDSCGSCEEGDNPELEQERALIAAADSAAADAEAAADRAALSMGCGFGATFGIGGSSRGLGASSAAHASANFTVTHNNSLYMHQDGTGGGDGAANGAGVVGVDSAGVVAEPAPELMPAPKTWHSTLDALWDRLSLALFLLALILDVVALASFAANDCGREWWVPTILFILAHTAFMGLVLLIHSQWSKRCWQSFLVVLNGPECVALRTPWCRQSSARFFLYVPQFLIALITLSLGTMVSAFVVVGIVICAVCAVPLLDLSAAAATIWPTGDKKRFRSQDLLFLENFKLARYSLQAVLQSLPQIILLAIALSSLGPINGDPLETQQCNAPEGVAIAALAVASLNVLDKLFQSGLQVKRMVGHHGLSGVRGLWQNMIDLVTVQGSHRVPFPVMDRTLAQMLRSASDFVVGADFVNEPPRPPPAQPTPTTPTSRAPATTQPPIEVVVRSSSPNNASPSAAQGAQGRSVGSQEGSPRRNAARSGSGSEGWDTSAYAAMPAGTPPPQAAPQPIPAGLPRLNITPSASPRAPHTLVEASRTGSPRTRNILRREGAQSSPSTPRMQHLDRVRNGVDLLRVMQGRGAELAERLPTPVAVPEERPMGSIWSRERPSGSVPLVPSLLLPPHGGRLEAGQMATVVREAIARYPHHSITRWAMESPTGANQGLVDIMAGGLTRFTALQNLTICKCKIGGHGFAKVAKLLVAHPHLTDLRFENVAMDKTAAGALADLVRNATRITRLDIAHCTFPKNHPEAESGIVRALGSNASLNTLTFAGNGLNAQGIRALTQGLSKNTTLGLLDLSSNRQLSSPPCLAALRELLQAVDQRQSQGESTSSPSLQSPLRLVLTIKDLGFAGAHQLVSQLGQRQQQALSQQQLPMPPCAIVSHGPLPPSCIRVSGLPLWLLAGGAEGQAAIEALMPNPPPRPSPHPNATQGMSPVRESPSPASISPQDTRQSLPSPQQPPSDMQIPAHAQNVVPQTPGQGAPGSHAAPVLPTHARPTLGGPGASQPPAAQPATGGAATPFSPFSQSGDGLPHGSSFVGQQHSQGSFHTSGPVRASNTSSENNSGSTSTVRGTNSPCELLLVCGGVDNLSLVGVLCSCHRVLGEFLSSLDLSGLSICDRGARLMGNLVQHTPRLEAVSLAGCNITDEGAEPLVEALTERMSQATFSPLLKVDVSRNTLGDGAASKLIQLALVAARARHSTAVRAVTAVALQCGCNPQAASATAAAAAAGQGETEAVQAVHEMGQKLRQQLRITLLDNLYPMSMEPLRGLQRALTKSAAPLSASAIAAEATMLLQPTHQQQPQQDAQHPLLEAQSQQGEAPTRESLPNAASPLGQQEEGQAAAVHDGSAPTPQLPPVTDHRAAAEFGSKSRSEVVAVALRIANTLLGCAHAAAANPPPPFVLELVHRPPGQSTAPPPPRPQPQAPSAARARRLSGRLSGQGLSGLRPIPSAAALELENIDVAALAPQQPPSPTSASGADAGATNDNADDSQSKQEPHPFREAATEFMLPSHSEERTTLIGQQQQSDYNRQQQRHRRNQHRRNVSASDVGCFPGLGASVAAAAPSFASSLLSPLRSTEANANTSNTGASNTSGLRRTSAGGVNHHNAPSSNTPFHRHSESLITPSLRSPRASNAPPASPPLCSSAAQPSYLVHSRSQHRRTPSDAQHSSSRPPHHRHTRTVSATESQIEATAAVISGALDGGVEGLTGLALVGLGPTPGHSRNVSGSMPALSRGHTRTLSATFTDGSDGDNGCGVCFDNPSNLLLRGCGHKICVQCYRQLVRPGAAPSARCPFCRSLITGFDYRLGSDQALLWH